MIMMYKINSNHVYDSFESRVLVFQINSIMIRACKKNNFSHTQYPYQFYVMVNTNSHNSFNQLNNIKN